MTTKLTKPADFFSALRSGQMLGPVLSQSEVQGLTVITDVCGRASWPVSWTSYALATAFHETAGTMRPIKEYGGDEYLRRRYDVTGMNPTRAKAMGNIHPGDGVKYCGKGFCQTTWFVNYKRAEDETGLPFTTSPDLMLQPEPAADVMIRGMQDGWFTGRRTAKYLPNTGTAVRGAFIMARAIINGQDRADDVADYAIQFQTAIMRGGWA